MSEYKLITNKIAPQKMLFRGAIFFNLALRTLIIRVYFINSALRTNIRVFFKFNFARLKYPHRNF